MKYAIITGASRGIGAATAQHFLEQGWNVINISRTPNSNKKINNILFDLTCENIEPLKAMLLPLIADASTVSLIHNAAVTIPDRIDNMAIHHFKKTLTINVTTPVILTHLLVDNMPPSSSIILLGSTLSEKGVPNNCSYIVTKHAIVGLMRSLVQDLTPKQIHACCVCPGLTETDMLQQMSQNTQRSYEDLKKIQLMERFILPSEIAEVIFFCATHPVVNDSVIHANMGQVA